MFYLYPFWDLQLYWMPNWTQSLFAIINHIKKIFVLFLGNLFVIVFVSYFGAKLHRPKLIGIGCFIMGLGSILTALPHFFMG